MCMMGKQEQHCCRKMSQGRDWIHFFSPYHFLTKCRTRAELRFLWKSVEQTRPKLLWRGILTTQLNAIVLNFFFYTSRYGTKGTSFFIYQVAINSNIHISLYSIQYSIRKLDTFYQWFQNVAKRANSTKWNLCDAAESADGGVSPWTSCQFIARPPRHKSQPSTRTHTYRHFRSAN